MDEPVAKSKRYIMPEDGVVLCPWCGSKDTEPWEYDGLSSDGDTIETSCNMCENDIVITLSVTYFFKTRIPEDKCPHDWREGSKAVHEGVYSQYFSCELCGDGRQEAIDHSTLAATLETYKARLRASEEKGDSIMVDLYAKDIVELEEVQQNAGKTGESEKQGCPRREGGG